ncbi:MAG: ribonuclease HII [Coxiellaceae bacterium]|jgi:ribonuclease HII|nr:ribonuclease HII [Coxiellaceae bacterium]
MNIVAGVDEVGRGPLAGPVMAAAVILDPKHSIVGLTDSKLLTSRKREVLSETIKKNCIAWALGSASPEEIDLLNILQASLLAMQRAIDALNIKPHHVQVDGQFLPKVNCIAEGIIKGDILVPSISAASILAKVARDEVMVTYDIVYPKYGFARHKGYATFQHLLALQQLGITPIHRRSFAPVKKYI